MRRLAFLAFTLLLSGCATVNKMAINQQSTTIDTSQKSVLLLALNVTRSEPSRFEPVPTVLRLEKPDAKDKTERQNFNLDKKKDSVVDGGDRVYLLRMAIDPGEYRIENASGSVIAFPFIATFDVPLRMNFVVKPNSVVYLGRMTATLRPRNDGEFRAGPLLPLLDQAATGLSKGTWDVVIDDKSKTDMELFRKTFPVLQAATIDTAILPAFDRAAVQRWWDGEEQKQQKGATANPAAAAP